MGRAYSRDLRGRVVTAVLEGGLSRRKAASQFAVGISTVINWVRRFRETGSVLPGQKWAATSRKQSPESTAPGCCSGSRKKISPCAASSPSSLNAASRSITRRYGISSIPRNSASKKTVLASEQDRPDVARRREQWKKYQTRIAPERLVFIDESVLQRHGRSSA
jgi:transposase-like protein